jgi:hypothetical protein
LRKAKFAVTWDLQEKKMKSFVRELSKEGKDVFFYTRVEASRGKNVSERVGQEGQVRTVVVWCIFPLVKFFFL